MAPANLRAFPTPMPIPHPRHAWTSVCLVLAMAASAQTKEQRFEPVCFGFYNVENLYDTIDSPDTDDHEFLPGAAKQWNTARYARKLDHMARVIAEMATDVHPDGLACLGLSEIENRSVLEDLVKAEAIRGRGYRIVHHDGPDRRGVDCAFLYDPERFTLLGSRSYRLNDPTDGTFRSRDQLLVSGVLMGDTTHFVVAHWPSRRGGEKASRPKRMLAAELGRHITDSLLARGPAARVVYMGDLNDDPIDASVERSLRSTGDKALAVDGRFFNPMVASFRKGIGSLAWQDSWNLFDQVLLSPAMVAGGGTGFHYYGMRVFNEPYLRQKDGNFAGYPFRTFVGDQYAAGYSDHFPVYVILVRPVAGE